MKYPFRLLYFSLLTLICCAQSTKQKENSRINKDGCQLNTRFQLPKGFARVPVKDNSFADYLRHLPLKPFGAKVCYYNGAIKENEVYDAVVDMNIGHQDLQQCADAVIRLRGEYLFQQKRFDEISFTLTNGFEVDYPHWMKGYRVKVTGNKTSWQKTAQPSNTYKEFRKYLDFVFMYAGTLSLSKSLHSKSIREIKIGDVFIKGGSPGHAVIVVDMAENKTGEKIFMLAQSYMPAQETQILKNPDNAQLSPWYSADISGDLETPEWIFKTNQLKTW
ncbi:DUF4846 domain-containing protein [Parabacteroides sp. FAFU027]|uniref:DUF4846 domain-containing protein n=1 Tax=Parabacteroides sp. FAFU027 TaxID=2922715 RepID=UPI001FAF7672|nr:DUF4846 domain-containing protein [Parabacteroides sp. FAFU027]